MKVTLNLLTEDEIDSEFFFFFFNIAVAAAAEWLIHSCKIMLLNFT